MAKKENASTPGRMPSAERDAKKQRQAAAAPGAGKMNSRQGHRTWRVEVVLTGDLAPNDNHPLAGLTQDQREETRRNALGQVLASIALRKARQAEGDVGQDEPSDVSNTRGA